MRRKFLIWAFAVVLPCLGKTESESVRGKLVQQPGRKPAIETKDHRTIYLKGDEPTTGVLNDKRLAGDDMEFIGHFTAPDTFLVDPIHTRAIFVYKDGKKLMVTYYCHVCSIRTYTPGKCMCCQRETELDLIPPDQQ